MTMCLSSKSETTGTGVDKMKSIANPNNFYNQNISMVQYENKC